MSKKIIYIILIIVAAIIIVFLFASHSGGSSDIQGNSISTGADEDNTQETGAFEELDNIDELLQPYQEVLNRLNKEYGASLYIPEDEKESVYRAYGKMTPEEFEAEILRELEEEAEGRYEADGGDIMIGIFSDKPSDSDQFHP